MPDLASIGRFIAHNPAATAGIGAGVGALANVGREALKGNEQPKSYVGAALRGAVAGGALGGAAGGIARAGRDTMLLHPELKGLDVAKKTVGRAGEGISNFAQRQLHGLTGYGSQDKAYLDRIGIAGSGPSRDRAKLLNLRAQDELANLPQGASLKDYVAREKGTEAIHKNLHEAVRGVAQEGQVGDRFHELGMTSAPGAVKAMATNPREASKAIWNQLRAGGKTGIALGLGVPVAATAGSLARGDESATGGPSMHEKLVRGVANVGGGLLFGGLPIASSNIVGGLTDVAAGRLGRAIAPNPTAASRIG